MFICFSLLCNSFYEKGILSQTINNNIVNIIGYFVVFVNMCAIVFGRNICRMTRIPRWNEIGRSDIEIDTSTYITIDKNDELKYCTICFAQTHISVREQIIIARKMNCERKRCTTCAPMMRKRDQLEQETDKFAVLLKVKSCSLFFLFFPLRKANRWPEKKTHTTRQREKINFNNVLPCCYLHANQDRLTWPIQNLYTVAQSLHTSFLVFFGEFLCRCERRRERGKKPPSIYYSKYIYGYFAVAPFTQV